MSILTWILIAILAFFSSALGTNGESVNVVQGPATPAALNRQDSGPLILASGIATRLVQTQPGSAMTLVASETGLYSSTDLRTWTGAGATPPPGIIVMADDADVLMTGEEEACARGGGGAGINVSTDGGATWTPSADERAIRPLAIWADDAFAIGAWCGGIVLSDDLGRTWASPPGDATLGYEVTAFAAIAGTDREVLFALTGEGGTTSVYHVDLRDPSAWDDPVPIFTYWALGGLAGSGDTFAIASITGVSITTDAGATWTTEREGLELYTLDVDPALEGLPEDVDPTGMGLRSIVLDESGTPIAVGGANDVFRRADDGSWVHGIGYGEPTTWLERSTDGTFVVAQAESQVWLVGLAP